MGLETSSDKVYPGLKVEAKSDLVKPDKIKVGVTYTEIKDTQLKLEATAMKPQEFVLEATRKVGDATLGMKCTKDNLTCPDFGIRMLSGQGFFSLLAKDKLSVFTAHAHFKASPELRCSAHCEQNQKKGTNFTLGIAYNVQKATQVKAKVAKDQTVSFTVKHALSKGFTVLAGGAYNVKSSSLSY